MNISTNSNTNVNFCARLNASMLRNYKEFAPEYLERVVSKIKTNNPHTFFSADAFVSNLHIPKDKTGEGFYHNMVPYVSAFDKNGKEIKEYLTEFFPGIRQPIATLMRGEVWPDEIATALIKFAESPTLTEDVVKAENRLMKSMQRSYENARSSAQEQIAKLQEQISELRNRYNLFS